MAKITIKKNKQRW